MTIESFQRGSTLRLQNIQPWTSQYNQYKMRKGGKKRIIQKVLRRN